MSSINGLTVAMVQMEIAKSPQENAARFIERARQAATEGADIIVGSEMMLAPYIRGDSYEDDEFVGSMEDAIGLIQARSQTINAVLIFGAIGRGPEGSVGEDGRLRKYNAAYVFHKGRLVCNDAGSPFAKKALLPNYRIFDDARYFYSLRAEAEEANQSLDELLKPFSVTIRGIGYKLGVMLCEDMWDGDYTAKPAIALLGNGADILINLSCSNWSWQKNRKRDQVIKTICEKTALPFVYVNNVGCQNNGKNFITFDGASTMYHDTGDIVAMCRPYEEEVSLVTLKRGLPTLVREEADDIAQMFTAIEVASRGFLKTLPLSVQNKVVIGVSGGIDSANSVAFFAHLLGSDKVLAVNMPYKHFNSEETKDDARSLCERLGVDYRVFPIDALVDELAKMPVGILPGTPQHKTAQAIARMNVLAATASQVGGFFTCNANWTEIFFGYGTLNGDMRGTFAPWMNCLKQDMYRLADHMNRVVFGREVIPQTIIDRPPMDELTAVGAGERKDPFDYGSVTENGYHDQMVRAVVAFRRGPEWFIDQYLNGTLESALKLSSGRLNELFPDGRTWFEDLVRCFRLYEAAVFKRIQSVPGPLVDKRTFGWDFRESIGVGFETERFKYLAAELKRIDYLPYTTK